MDPTVQLLNRVDDIEGVQGVGVVSWNWAEVEGWVQRWNANVLDPLNPLPGPQLPPFSNAVVEDALRKLTRQVNVQTGIIHPSDYEAAFACFVAPDSPDSWLRLTLGWTAARVIIWFICSF